MDSEGNRLSVVAPGPDHLPFLPFALPWIGEEEIAAVVDCLRSGWITTGPRVRQFEAEFAEQLGCRHAIAVNSCTAALHLSLDAIGVGPGDEVLVPTMTFAATAAVVCHRQARPRLVDCRSETLNIDASQVQRFLEESCVRDGEGVRNRETGARVRAVIPVHYAGLPCDIEPLLTLARHYGLAVVEDAAHAIPCHVAGRPAGTFGTAGAFSFYATKNITTGEGGMVVTQDDALAERVRVMSLHGISRNAWMRYTSRGSWSYEILAPGYKYNMTDVAAAIGLEQLRRCDALWQIRRRYAERYTAAFRTMPEIEPPADAPPGSQHAWHLYAIRLALSRLKIDRGAFVEELKRRGIGTSVHFIPLHLHPFYRATYGYTPGDLPVATQAFEGLISLPLYPRMPIAAVDRVIDAVTEIVNQNRR